MVSAVRYRIQCNFLSKKDHRKYTNCLQSGKLFLFFLLFQSFLNIFLSFIILSIVSQSQIHADTFWLIGGNDAELGIGSPCG